MRYSLSTARALFVAMIVSAGLVLAPGLAWADIEDEPTASNGTYGAETFMLDNGMQVVVISNDRAPVVSHMVWYKVGSADDPPGKSGLAHYVEHLMFKGTEEVGPGEFSRTVSRLGGDGNAFTSYDYTGYFQNVASEHLGTVMALEADRMRNLTFPPEELAPELEVVLEERFQTSEQSPDSKLNEEVQAALFVHHPYGTPIIGWEQEIRSFTRDDAVDFYDTWYAPNNAILVVSGDVTVEELKPLAEEHYGAVPSRAVPERERVQEPPLWSDRRVTLAQEDVQQPTLRRHYPAPSYNTDDEGHAHALVILSEIIGGTTTSWLYQDLVTEQTVATSAGSWYRASALDGGQFGLFVSPSSPDATDRAEDAMEAVIERLLADGVTGDEVETARNRLLSRTRMSEDSLTAPARVFGMALTTGRSIEDVEYWPERLAEVTAEEVAAAAARIFDGQPHVTGILLPEDGIDGLGGLVPTQ